MTDIERRIATLESEVTSLRAVHEIQQLRFKYWFAVVDKAVDRLMECFSDDVYLEYGFGIELKGIEAVRAFFKKVLETDDLISQIPRGSNPAIAVISETEAEGRWLVEVVALRHSQEDGRRVGTQYFEKYRKTDSGWKICELKNEYLGFESFVRRDSP